MTEAGYISDYEKLVGKRRTRRYYHIEPKGKEYYKEILADYDAVATSISRILDREAGV